MLDSLHAEETAPALAQQPEAEPQPAEPDEAAGEELSGFDLLEAYSRKIEQFKEFQVNRGLQGTDLQQRTSRAADELNRIIGGLELLMEREAERMYEQAMKADDPQERDRVLNQLQDMRYPELQNIRRRAENALNRRTVGETVHPTVEEAREAKRKLAEERRERQAELDQQDLEDVEQLKQELLTDRVSEAAQAFAEEDARRMLEAAVRFVLPQRRERLNEIVRRYPNTQAAADAAAILNAIQRQDAFIAGRKLQKALHAPVIHDQRWRRLKEIERDHPHTPAATEARQIFAHHVAQVPPVVIANHAPGEVELTVDRPYSLMDQVTLSAGETRTFTTAFPLMVRVKINDSEWQVYRVWPGASFVLQAPHGIPVLCPALNHRGKQMSHRRRSKVRGSGTICTVISRTVAFHRKWCLTP